MKQLLLVHPDDELSKKLKENFTAQACIEALMNAVSTIATAIGVTISWNISHVDPDKNVDRDALSIAAGQVLTVLGAIFVGGKINLFSTVDKKVKSNDKGCEGCK